MESLEKDREPLPHMEAIYIIRPTEEVCVYVSTCSVCVYVHSVCVWYGCSVLWVCQLIVLLRSFDILIIAFTKLSIL